jgi:hypothetical protein
MYIVNKVESGWLMCSPYICRKSGRCMIFSLFLIIAGPVIAQFVFMVIGQKIKG